jgi:hypothetical protein
MIFRSRSKQPRPNCVVSKMRAAVWATGHQVGSGPPVAAEAEEAAQLFFRSFPSRASARQDVASNSGQLAEW